MFCNNLNYEDVKKYYQGTWVKIEECGERIYTVDKVTSKYTDLSSPSRGEGDDEAEIRIDMEVGYNLNYVIPKKTVYQYGERALLLQRVPARMWRKGMDAKNTEFLSLDEKGNWKKTALATPVIEGFINKPSYYSVEDALVGFDNALESAALTRRVTLTKGGGVFIDTVYVGKLEKKGLAFKAIYESNLAPLFPPSIKLNPV